MRGDGVEPDFTLLVFPPIKVRTVWFTPREGRVVPLSLVWERDRERVTD
jgi:hypothetical protein